MEQTNIYLYSYVDTEGINMEERANQLWLKGTDKGKGRVYSQAPIDSLCSTDFTISSLVLLTDLVFSDRPSNS